MARDVQFSGERLAGGTLMVDGVEIRWPLAVSDLVHSALSGTTNGTLVDCTATYNEAAVEENFKELAVAYNNLLAALRASGFMK